MPYPEYLQTPHWCQMRRRALWLAHYCCQRCRARHDLNVHHLTYERRGCEDDDDLEVLCRSCHQKTHGIKEEA